jgi:putative membrane protein
MDALERQRRILLAVHGALFVALAVWAAIEPFDRKDWALESLLVVVAFVVLVATHRVLPLSSVSYTLIFMFLCLHALGSHYTYAEVPYDAWTRDWFGIGFNEWVGWERNNDDRVVHFANGLLLAYPVREVALIAMLITATFNWRTQHDFAREWMLSVRVRRGSLTARSDA